MYSMCVQCSALAYSVEYIAIRRLPYCDVLDKKGPPRPAKTVHSALKRLSPSPDPTKLCFLRPPQRNKKFFKTIPDLESSVSPHPLLPSTLQTQAARLHTKVTNTRTTSDDKFCYEFVCKTFVHTNFGSDYYEYVFQCPPLYFLSLLLHHRPNANTDLNRASPSLPPPPNDSLSHPSPFCLAS